MIPCANSYFITICYLTLLHKRSIVQMVLATLLEQVICKNCVASFICPFYHFAFDVIRAFVREKTNVPSSCREQWRH